MLSNLPTGLQPAVRTILGWLCLAVGCAGCAEDTVEFREVKRPDERIRSGEWAAFKRIVEQLPEPKLREVTDVLPPLPDWQPERTLPVNELATEERRLLQRAWDPNRLAPQLENNPSLARLLRHEGLTVEQFVGIALAIGAAMRRAHLPEDYSLDDLLRRGDVAVKQLMADQRLFATLSLEARSRVLDEAIWLHRVDRAQRLRDVPPENVALVRRHADLLQSVMADVLRQHPFEDVVDLLEEQGIPFIELPQSGSDADIEWSRSDALVGR